MLAERNLKEYIEKRLKQLRWDVVRWDHGVNKERNSLKEIFLKGRLFKALDGINWVSLKDRRKSLISKLIPLPNTVEGTRNSFDFIEKGVPLEIRRDSQCL